MQQAFSVRDNKAETYGEPFYRPNQVVAIRSLSDAIAEGNNPWAKHPDDYSLYHVGEWDDTEGDLIAATKTHICNLAEIADTLENAN